LCLQIVIPSKKLFYQEALPNLVEKTKELYVLIELAKCLLATASFDLWMFKGSHGIFALVVNFLDANLQPKQVTIGLSEATETIGQALAVNLSNLLDSFGLTNKIIKFVKDEGANLNAMTLALKFIVSCDILRWEESFNRGCFGHAFSKACQYGIAKEKNCKRHEIRVNYECTI
jgi:hypothetical protein